MGRTSSSSTSSTSDSDTGRSRDRRHSRSKGKRSGKFSEKCSSKRSKTTGQLRTSESRSLTPEITILQNIRQNVEPDNLPSQQSSISVTGSVESRVGKIEEMLEKLIRQGTQQECHRSSVRSECIPEFDPENEHISAHQWLEKVDQIKGVNNWDDITTIYQMQSRLRGMAKSWCHNLTSYPATWIEWKALLTKTFPVHVDYAAVLRKMLERTKKPDETMTTYYFQKMELIRTCQISARNAVSCLIDGISDVSIQNSARAGRYVTPEALYEEYLSMLRDEKPVKKEARVESTVRRVPTGDLRYGLTTKNQSLQKFDASNIQCFNCKMRGHYQSQCPKQRKECQKCHLLGHDASKCMVGKPPSFRKHNDLQAKGSKN